MMSSAKLTLGSPTISLHTKRKQRWATFAAVLGHRWLMSQRLDILVKNLKEETD